MKLNETKCYEEFEHGGGACLVLEAIDGHWSFPWVTLVCVHWPHPDQNEITITFHRHEVSIVGKNMFSLFASLAQGKVKVVRTGQEGELVVTTVKVVEGESP